MLQVGDYVSWNRQGVYIILEFLKVDSNTVVKIQEAFTDEAHLTQESNVRYLARSEKELLKELSYDERAFYLNAKGDDGYSVVTDQMKKDCSDESGLALEIVNILYPTAYEFGHSNGVSEVYHYLIDLCYLTKEVVEHVKKGGAQ